MRYYVVLHEWPGENCWECPGDQGRAWDIVRADSADQAIQLVAPVLQTYDDQRVMRAYEVAERPGPQAKVAKRLGFGSKTLWMQTPAPDRTLIIDPPKRTEEVPS